MKSIGETITSKKKRLKNDLARARQETSASQVISPGSLEKGTQVPTIHVGAMHFPMEIFSGNATELETHISNFVSMANCFQLEKTILVDKIMTEPKWIVSSNR